MQSSPHIIPSTPLRLALVLMLIASITSCTTQRQLIPQVVRETTHDTLYLNKVQYDSIYIEKFHSQEYHPYKPTSNSQSLCEANNLFLGANNCFCRRLVYRPLCGCNPQGVDSIGGFNLGAGSQVKSYNDSNKRPEAYTQIKDVFPKERFFSKFKSGFCQLPTDTIIIRDVSTQYRYKLLRDTIRIIHTDTIPIIKEVEVSPKRTNITDYLLTGLSILMITLLLTIILRHFKNTL